MGRHIFVCFLGGPSACLRTFVMFVCMCPCVVREWGWMAGRLELFMHTCVSLVLHQCACVCVCVCVCACVSGSFASWDISMTLMMNNIRWFPFDREQTYISSHVSSANKHLGPYIEFFDNHVVMSVEGNYILNGLSSFISGEGKIHHLRGWIFAKNHVPFTSQIQPSASIPNKLKQWKYLYLSPCWISVFSLTNATCIFHWDTEQIALPCIENNCFRLKNKSNLNF